MQANYFGYLNNFLKDKCSRDLPYCLVDLNKLDKNIEELNKIKRSNLDYRLVVKSLPSPELLYYLRQSLSTNKLMVFHQPFLSQIAAWDDDLIDIILGKPMPVKTARYFYQELVESSRFNPFQQIQWLIDTPQRANEYIGLAKSLGHRIRVNLEIDVGLHRGGVDNLEMFRQLVQLLKSNKEYITISGLMGYDPHVVKLPKLIKSGAKAFTQSIKQYEEYASVLKDAFPKRQDWIFNGGGSPTVSLHNKHDSVINDLAVGSALLKPTTFDIPSLNEFMPASFIATPILKKLRGTRIPGLEHFGGLLKVLKKSHRHSYFIYGGYWKADFCFPPDAHTNAIFGASTNQSMVNSSMDLKIGNYVFLRPQQSEFVLLQFGDILAIRDDSIEGVWPIFQN